MPLDIDGAGRSSTLACLPTARGTVAPTTTRYLEEFSSRLVPFPARCLGFFALDPRGVWGGPGPPLRANFETRGPECQERGQKQTEKAPLP